MNEEKELITQIYFDTEVENSEQYREFKNEISKFSISGEIHVLSKPLLITDNEICTGDGVAVVENGKKIVFLKKTTSSEEDFEDFVFDFKQLLSELIGKYKFRSLLGKPSKVQSDEVTFTTCELKNYITESENGSFDLQNSELEYANVIGSLIKGSVNDNKKIEKLLASSVDETDYITKAKNRIISFDTNQTRFIFPTKKIKSKKREVVQGMAGSGKTEMLLHRLRTLYIDTEEENVKIAFACFNKVLASELRSKKINQFFNNMKYENQLLWDERLFCFPAWGSSRNKVSGMYSYICNFYDLQFKNYTEISNFEKVCELAIDELKEKKIKEYAFDYVLIDESQDMPDSFFNLCEMVTKVKVYIAGDVYQDIFDTNSSISKKPDFLLNRVYRTENRTFLFSHLFALGYFDKKLKWLDKEDLNLCGYQVEEKESTYKISRSQFDNRGLIPNEKIFELQNESVLTNIDNIILEINELKIKYDELVPSDIAIVILSRYKKFNIYAEQLSKKLYSECGFQAQISSPGNELNDECVYISNQNHIKGLEFPFVFVLYDDSDVSFASKEYIRLRTAFYMAATRSLIKSYLYLVDDEKKYDNIKEYSTQILDTNSVEVVIPNETEIQEMNEVSEKIKYNTESRPLTNLIEDKLKKYISEKEGTLQYELYSDEELKKACVSVVMKRIIADERKDILDEIKRFYEYAITD